MCTEIVLSHSKQHEDGAAFCERDSFILVEPQGQPESHTIHEVDFNDKVLIIKMFC